MTTFKVQVGFLQVSRIPVIIATYNNSSTWLGNLPFLWMICASFSLNKRHAVWGQVLAREVDAPTTGVKLFFKKMGIVVNDGVSNGAYVIEVAISQQ